MMRWVRKGNLIAGLVAAVLLSVFLAIFKDPMLKWGFKKAARAAAGAKVDIGSVETSLLHGRLVLSRVAVADKSEPMKNLFSLEEASFRFSPWTALRAKIVMPEATISGLRFGTARKKSGAVSGNAGAPSALERSIAEDLGSEDALLDGDSLSHHLLGPLTARNLTPALYWISWIRRHMAISAPAAMRLAEASPGRFGVNVEFPLQDSTPQFLLERAAIFGAVDQGGGLPLKGSVTGINSNPPLYGRPTFLSLAAGIPGKGPALDLQGFLDQTKKPQTAEVSLHASGMDLAGLRLGDSKLGALILRGTALANATLRISGDAWKGAIMIQAEDVALEPTVGLTGPSAQRAASALTRAKKFSSVISFEGTENGLHFHISSDLGQAVAREIQLQ